MRKIWWVTMALILVATALIVLVYRRHNKPTTYVFYYLADNQSLSHLFEQEERALMTSKVRGYHTRILAYLPHRGVMEYDQQWHSLVLARSNNTYISLPEFIELCRDKMTVWHQRDRTETTRNIFWFGGHSHGYYIRPQDDHYVSVAELVKILRPLALTIVVFDSCGMASLECAHEFRGYIPYIIATPEYLGDVGLLHTDALAKLCEGKMPEHFLTRDTRFVVIPTTDVVCSQLLRSCHTAPPVEQHFPLVRLSAAMNLSRSIPKRMSGLYHQLKLFREFEEIREIHAQHDYDLRVMTLNLQECVDVDTLKRWIDVCEEAEADVLCLQELQAPELFQFLKMRFNGNLQFTDLENGTAVIHLGDSPVPIHIRSVHLDDLPAPLHILANIPYADNPADVRDFADLWQRCEQARLPMLSAVVAEIPPTGLTIIAGDFNEPPGYPCDLMLKSIGFRDVVNVDNNDQHTWPHSPFYQGEPSQRIDRIYIRGGEERNVRVVNSGRYSQPGGKGGWLSDHYAVIADLVFDSSP
jgi:endonuclease/exonuclease/phosphatase family metal-dependent hydrolase